VAHWELTDVSNYLVTDTLIRNAIGAIDVKKLDNNFYGKSINDNNVIKVSTQ